MSSSTPEERAIALMQAQRFVEAQAAWREILERSPGDARALHFLGCALAGTGRLEEGLALVDRSLAAEPRNAAFLANRARLLGDAGRLEEAVADLRRAIRRDPVFAGAFLHLGILLLRLERPAEALAALRRAAALDPQRPAAHAELGRALFDAGDFGGAGECFRRALALQPGDAGFINNLGLVLKAQGRVEEAVACYREALERRPGFADALVNWGHALKDAGDLDGAGALYERSIAERPDFAEGLLNAAGASLDRGDIGRSAELYGRALALAPASADARYGLGQVALREHRFAEGWSGYEARFATHPPQASARAIPLPRLTMDRLHGARRVAVWTEQGVGDQILFGTLLPELAAHGIAAVVEVDPRLHGMFRRALPGIEIVAPGAGEAAFGGCDAQIALGSLPALFRPDVSSFERQPRALLAPDPERVERMRALLGPGRWIAIAWRSQQKGGRDALARRKSAPLEAFAALAAASGARLLDLQYGEVAEERRQFAARHPGVLTTLDSLDTWNDFEGMAAAIAACERVVTASNVTAHLAGAIGAPATVAYPGATAPFPYWVPGADGRSLWYPSVAIATEASWTSWEAALAGVAARL